MKKTKRNILCLFALAMFFVLQPTYGQENLRIGEWDSHLSYSQVTWVTQSDQEIFLNTGTAIVKISKSQLNSEGLLEAEELSKIDGLSEAGIDKILYDRFNNQLIVAYESSNIDIVSKQGVINIPFIKDNTNIIGARTINAMHISDANNCYIGCVFGLINLDLQNLEFNYTTFTSTGVTSITSDDSNLYMGLEDGLYTIGIDDVNPIDFSRWQLQSGSAGLPALYECSSLANFNNSIYAVINDELYKLGGDQKFEKIDIDQPDGYEIIFMTADYAHLIIGLRNDNLPKAEIRRIDEGGQVMNGGADCIFLMNYGIEDQSGRIWYADGYRGIRYTNTFDSGCNVIELNGPWTSFSSQIEVGEDGKVYFASGGASDNYALLSNRDGIYILENNSWTNINESLNQPIKDSGFLNFVSVAPPQNDTKIYAASYYSGLMSYDQESGEFEFFDGKNSPLKSAIAGDDRARVSYVNYDNEGNLWISNFLSSEPIVVLTKDGVWKSFSIPSSNTNVAKSVIDNRGNVWFVLVGNNGGVLVYDKGERITDPTDDRIRIITNSNSEIPSQLVNCLAVDEDGEVWVGTSQGPVSFDCDPFDEDCRGNRRKVLQDSIAAFLLDTEEILSIDFDGGNRKWFGTKNGIFVQSPDGEIQEERYTSSNSPLFSNTVQDMDYDPKTGRMYISTDNGIQSIQTATLGAKRSHANTVYAYPNPVPPNYEGEIAIKGLGRDANVKITDLNGKLVYETQALGGLATWNGQDYNGRRVASGVYLVFSTSKISFDTSDNFVTKIMIVD